MSRAYSTATCWSDDGADLVAQIRTGLAEESLIPGEVVVRRTRRCSSGEWESVEHVLLLSDCVAAPEPEPESAQIDLDKFLSWLDQERPESKTRRMAESRDRLLRKAEERRAAAKALWASIAAESRVESPPPKPVLIEAPPDWLSPPPHPSILRAVFMANQARAAKDA